MDVQLTPLQIECGVTVEQVRVEVPRAAFASGGRRVIVAAGVSPALGEAVASHMFREPATYCGMNALQMPVYRRTRRPGS